MKDFKRGFTLTEVMIVLSILGVLAFLLVPMIKNMLPDDHRIKYKKAFTTIQEIVNDMVSNEETCQKYNVNTGAMITNPLEFCNVITATNDASDNPNAYTERTLNNEICERLNTTAGVNCSGDITSIETTNGMVFTLPSANIALNSGFSETEITVTLDGTPYRIIINPNGKVTAPSNIVGGVEQETESKYLKENPNKD